jgi:hypothetical protein
VSLARVSREEKRSEEIFSRYFLTPARYKMWSSYEKGKWEVKTSSAEA